MNPKQPHLDSLHPAWMMASLQSHELVLILVNLVRSIYPSISQEAKVNCNEGRMTYICLGEVTRILGGGSVTLSTPYEVMPTA